ncbi:pyridoxal-phosphate-dependent aminotransferase family protein [Anaeromyxobacter paludicola]|uniref:Class V aminotransferase n=1 Tax=Anaeromyxobacter paludicola TaxID=2918171 RepID=A0ABM7X8H5_9BACT|nr:alanine--glyoxylate aminotransferase family protein [Anaeromyxobacter paludicola]BDG08092.1 class V aminotransferase [Anaeromyxobacter paludicola]
MALKSYLLTPGPTPVPERIALAMAQPILHHRAPAFEKLFAQVREDLKWLFQTKQDVLVFLSSGTGAMEGAVTNFLRRGDKAIVVNGGKFGERWGKILKAYGVEPIELKVEWGRAVEPAQVAKALEQHPDAKAVYVQASESSTGVAHPVKEICALTRDRPNTLTVVDAISALGAFDLPMDAWGMDVLLSGSQKALMLPPGLAFAAASEKAWKMAETSDLPRFYFNWKKEREMQAKNQTNYTPAVSLIVGLAEVLRWLKEDGLEKTFRRHERMSLAARAAVTALGMKLYTDSPSMALTTVIAPEGIDTDKLVKVLRDRYGVTLVGGQDQAKGKIFRIAHLGYFDEFDICTAITAIERALADMGAKVELGKGVGAAMRSFAETA